MRKLLFSQLEIFFRSKTQLLTLPYGGGGGLLIFHDSARHSIFYIIQYVLYVCEFVYYMYFIWTFSHCFLVFFCLILSSDLIGKRAKSDKSRSKHDHTDTLF